MPSTRAAWLSQINQERIEKENEARLANALASNNCKEIEAALLLVPDTSCPHGYTNQRILPKTRKQGKATRAQNKEGDGDPKVIFISEENIKKLHFLTANLQVR